MRKQTKSQLLERIEQLNQEQARMRAQLAQVIAVRDAAIEALLEWNGITINKEKHNAH